MGNLVIRIIKRWQSMGYSIVFTNGCFDIMHVGHIKLLKRAKEFGDKLVVGLNADESVKKIKGDKRPILSEEERYTFLSSLPFVDAVCLFNSDTPNSLIRVIKPDVIVKGGNYAVEDVFGYDLALKTIIIPMETGYSTTEIIDRIRRAYCG